MGFMKSPLGQPGETPATIQVSPTLTGCVQSAFSPSGAFRLDWADGEIDRHRFVPGWWRLSYGPQVCAQGALRRPQEGKVADSGVFILTDWIGWSGETSAILYAFDAAGRCGLQQKSSGAIPLTSAIAPDGSLAAWSYGVDNRVECYELGASRLRWSVSLPMRAAKLVIDLPRGYLWAGDEEGRTLWVRLADGAVDEAQVRAIVLDDPFGALNTVRAEFEATTGTPTQQQVAEWNGILERAIAKRLHEYPRLTGQALRLEGEIVERAGDRANALRFYLEAMTVDPKAGVKRRVDALQAERITASPRLEIVWMARETQAQRTEAAPSAPIEPRPETPYANTVCPYCGIGLNPLPKAKKKCPGCGQPIYVRSGPDGQRHLLREADLAQFETWWQRDAEEREQREAAARAAEDARLGLISGDADVEVVGESHYQAALEWAAGGRRPQSAQVPVIAELIREPTNRHDRNAVRVVVGGQTVGYLCREDAEDYQGLLRRLEREHRPARCRATIVGGWDDGRTRGSFGIELDGLPFAE
jgi:hypothetical protein